MAKFRRILGGARRALVLAGLVAVVAVGTATPSRAAGTRPSTVTFSVSDFWAGTTRAFLDVSRSSGDFAPTTGTVEVREGSRLVGTFPADDGYRPGDSLPPAGDNTTLGQLGAGTHTLTATYSGDATFAPSSATATFTLWARKSQSSIDASAGQSPSDCSPGGACPSPNVAAGSPVTFSAVVSDQPGASSNSPGAPTGTATFYEHTTNKDLGSAPLRAGKVQWTTSALAVGRHMVMVRYSGDGFFEGNHSSGGVRLEVTSSGGSSPAGTGPSSGTAAPTARRSTAGGSTAGGPGTTTRTGSANEPSSAAGSSIDTTETAASAQDGTADNSGDGTEDQTPNGSGRFIGVSRGPDGGNGLLVCLAAVLLGGAGAGATASLIRRRRRPLQSG